MDEYEDLFTLEIMCGGPKNLLVPHFLDETNRKPMGHGS